MRRGVRDAAVVAIAAIVNVASWERAATSARSSRPRWASMMPLLSISVATS
jgi:hypothetical protein